MFAQHLQRAVDVEALDGQPERADARALISGCRPEFQELRSAADAQQHRRSLARLHGHAKQSLIEIERALHVGHGQRELAQPGRAERRRACLRDEPRRVRESR